MNKEELFYYKLKNDKEWYIESFLKIRDKKSQLIPFKINEAQKIVLDKVRECEEKNKLKRFIVLKARQMGLSTLFEGLIFHNTSTNSFKNSMIIAHEDKATQNLFSMSKLYLDEIPEVIRPMIKYSNEKALVFENPSNEIGEKNKNPGLRSKITVSTAGATKNDAVGRSSTVHNLHASEVAFFPDARLTMLGLLQCVPDEMNTLVVLESTANGVGDWFHGMWQKATRGENEFIPIFLPWFIDPSYSKPFSSDVEKQQFASEVDSIGKDSKGNSIRTYEYELMEKNNLTYEQLHWRKWTIANKCQGDEFLFMQEYPSTADEAFISSGRPKFLINALKKYQTYVTKPRRGYLFDRDGKLSFVDDDNGYISIWKFPEQDKFYCIGADVAEGLVHGDYSCAMVGDSENFDIVAQWHAHIDPDLFGVELDKLGRYYNGAYVGVENNNHGGTTLSVLKRLEYWNLFFTKTYDRMAETVTQKVGWNTNIRTKPFMIDKLAEFVREMYLGISSETLISEMYSYIIVDDGKTEAQSGCFDDAVMATAIMLQLLLEGKGESYVPEVPIDQREKYRKEIIDPLFERPDKEEFSC